MNQHQTRLNTSKHNQITSYTFFNMKQTLANSTHLQQHQSQSNTNQTKSNTISKHQTKSIKPNRSNIINKHQTTAQTIKHKPNNI